MKNCTEFHSSTEKRNCCRGNKCNNESNSSTIVWPSQPHHVMTIDPTKSSNSPPLPTEATSAPSAPPTIPGNIHIPSIPTPDHSNTNSTELDTRLPKKLLCHCSTCSKGGKVCQASVACAYHTQSVPEAFCVNDKSICTNNAFQLTCCYKDYCNKLPKMPTPGPPCDDEDFDEQSGGCENGKWSYSHTNMVCFVRIFTLKKL